MAGCKRPPKILRNWKCSTATFEYRSLLMGNIVLGADGFSCVKPGFLDSDLENMRSPAKRRDEMNPPMLYATGISKLHKWAAVSKGHWAALRISKP